MSDLIDRNEPLKDCESCRYNNLDWGSEPCDSCTMGCESNHYKPSAQTDVTDINVGDTISRAAAIDALEKVAELYQWRVPGDRDSYSQYNEAWQDALNRADSEIEALPTAQPDTARRIVGKSRDGMTLWYQCDMCNEPVDAQDNFCRGCGRRLIDE